MVVTKGHVVPVVLLVCLVHKIPDTARAGVQWVCQDGFLPCVVALHLRVGSHVPCPVLKTCLLDPAVLGLLAARQVRLHFDYHRVGDDGSAHLVHTDRHRDGLRPAAVKAVLQVLNQARLMVAGFINLRLVQEI